MSVAGIEREYRITHEVEASHVRQGLVWLVTFNTIVALVSIVAADLISNRLWSHLGQPPVGIDRFLGYFQWVCTTIPSAQILAVMICAAIFPVGRVPGILLAIVPAFFLGVFRWISYSVVSDTTLLPLSIVSQMLSPPSITLYMQLVIVFAGVKIILAMLGWSVQWKESRKNLNQRQFGLLAIFEWMTLVGVLIFIAQANGWLHPRQIASWITWGWWQMLASAPLALAILSNSKWRPAWITAAIMVVPAALIGPDLYAMGWAEIRVLGVFGGLNSIAYILVISLNFLALRRLGYRLVIPTWQSQVAVA